MKVEHMHSLWANNIFLRVGPAKMHAHVYQETYTRMFMVALFITANMQNNTKAHKQWKR